MSWPPREKTSRRTIVLPVKSWLFPPEGVVEVEVEVEVDVDVEVEVDVDV
jgi:hypothetical protein